METIFALASAQGRAGVSVIRISGPEAQNVASAICGDLPQCTRPALRTLRGMSGDVIDQALVMRFEAPRSFTGEDVVEFQVHGSIAVVKALLTTLGAQPHARLAEPGEFTRRALENEKLDVTQIEGLGDLINAETEAQRQQALRTFGGELGRRVEIWRTALIRAAALLEATIDFADEEVPVDVSDEVVDLLNTVAKGVASELDGIDAAERIRHGFEVAIIGAPNVGKSTLLNCLAGRDAAITSDVEGTTRDVIEVHMEIRGFPVTVLDTAGLRESSDTVEMMGIERALERAAAADLRVHLKNAEDQPLMVLGKDDIVVRAKADVHGSVEAGVSGKTGLGVPNLLDRIGKTLARRASPAGLATHERHRTALLGAKSDIAAAVEQMSVGPAGYDIAAEEVRASIRALESLVGRIDVENVLDEIFSSFCLGK